MNGEQLIERARKAVSVAKDSIWRTSPDPDGDAQHEATLDEMLAVFEQAQKPALPSVQEFVLIEGGVETDWVDPVVEFTESDDGYRVWNGYSNYWFSKGPDIAYVIRAKEQSV